MNQSPIMFEWDGEAMVPRPGFQKRCDERFVVGEHYRLEVIEERSAQSHNHYFAVVKEAWDNLPERQAERFPSPDHLRKYALIKAGYYDERSIVCASKAEATRVAAFIRPMDDYAIVDAREAVVLVLTAKSQRQRAMGKEEFQKSKEAVIALLADLIGTTQRALTVAAGSAA